MTLLEECKAFRDRLSNGAFIYPVFTELAAIISRHEHDDWKGPWKCDKCGFMASRAIRHYEISQGCMTDDFCDGNWRPYERRRAERRKA